jgi:hypothetical protein
MNFSVVGIDGKDIYDGNKVLTLGILWQLMRAYSLSVLEKLAGGSRIINDAAILEYVNSTVCIPRRPIVMPLEYFSPAQGGWEKIDYNFL